MRNIDYPYDHASAYSIWQQYRHGGTYADVPATTLDPVILASWKRCTDYFSHTTLGDVKPVLVPVAPLPNDLQDELLVVGRPYLEDIHQFLEGAASAVILTDNRGVVIAIEGTLTTINTIHKIGMAMGESWLESRVGTNAIGLSLITAMPTQVVGAEHYMQIFHGYGSSAAPVHDVAGNLIGTVAILTAAEQTNQSQQALVMATARAITNQLQANLNLQQANQRTRQLDSILESVTEGVITWNNSGVVEHVNSIASQMLGVRQTALRGKPLDHLMGLPHYVHSAIEQQRELNDTEARVQIDNRFLQCVINTRLIYDGAFGVIGGVLMLRPLSQLRSFVNRQTNNAPQITFDDFIYESSAMHTVVRQAKMAAKGSGPALLMGEAGGGKTILAQAIHNASPRSSKPFVIVSCGMIPAEYMREALLGCDPHRDRPGQPSKFELADGGTLLLDNIDQLTLEAQQIVAGVISSRRVHRLYAPRPISINVRVIAMTTQDLEPMIETGGFLAELYYLFNAFRIQVPALRERAADLVPMIYRVLHRIGDPSNTFEVEPAALDLLVNYAWPGNVRELESVLERIVIQAEGNVIHVDDLPEDIRSKHAYHPEANIPARAVSLYEAEREAIIAAGWACSGVVSAMADTLGINRSTLWRKLKQHNISARDFKHRATDRE